MAFLAEIFDNKSSRGFVITLPVTVRPAPQMCSTKSQQEDCGKATDCGESHTVLEVGYLLRPETLFPPILVQALT